MVRKIKDCAKRAVKRTRKGISGLLVAVIIILVCLICAVSFKTKTTAAVDNSLDSMTTSMTKITSELTTK